jgi:ABC-type polysaccharide/polyol phosphate export permease
MRGDLAELWRFRELLWSLAERELRIRYKNSVLGFFWSLLNPLITALVMTLVFKYFLGQGVGSYGLYVLSAYLPYMFFQFALMDSSQSVIAALPIIRKVYFPREVLPLAHVLANLIHFMLAMGVFFLIAVVVWLRHPGAFPIQATALLLPVLVIIHVALVSGLGLIVSALNTFYEDVKYLLGAGLYMLFFLSPVMYFSENVYAATQSMGERGSMAYFIYHLNPIATLVTSYRKLLLAPTPVPVQGSGTQPALPMDWTLLGICALTSFAILWLGYAMFNRMKWRFVERP